MKVDRVKCGLIAMMMAVPLVALSVPNADPNDPADVESVFLHAFDKIKAGIINVNPETNQDQNPIPSAKTLTVTPTHLQHTTSVTAATIPANNTSPSDQQIQTELTNLRRQNASLQTRVSGMNQEVNQLREALVESQKLLSQNLNALQSSSLKPHKAGVSATLTAVAPQPHTLNPQLGKTDVELLPPPQLPEETPPVLPEPRVTATPVSSVTPSASVQPVTNAVSEAAPPQNPVEEETMPTSFLDNTMFLLSIGLVLILGGLLLLIWLFWPRKSIQEEPLPIEPKAPIPPTPEVHSEQPAFLVQPEEVPLEEKIQEEEIYADEEEELEEEELDQEPLKISELESFEELIEEEQEYLGNKQGTYERFADDDMDYSFMDSKDAIPVKLDLARAYLEMGDYDSVNETLKMVLQSGSKAQQREAELLLEQARLAQGD